MAITLAAAKPVAAAKRQKATLLHQLRERLQFGFPLLHGGAQHGVPGQALFDFDALAGRQGAEHVVGSELLSLIQAHARHALSEAVPRRIHAFTEPSGSLRRSAISAWVQPSR